MGRDVLALACALGMGGCYTGVDPDLPAVPETTELGPGEETAGGSDEGGGRVPADPDDPDPSCSGVGALTLRELTAREYDNTVRDLAVTDDSVLWAVGETESAAGDLDGFVARLRV